MTTSTAGMHLSRHTYVPWFLQTVKKYIVTPLPFWSCLHQKSTTTFLDVQRLFDSNMKTHFRTTRRVKTSGMHLSGRTYVPFFSKPLRNIYFSPTRHLLTLSTPEKTLQCFSDWQRLFDLNRKTHFKTSRRKGLRLPSRTTAEIHYLPFTAFHLVANDMLQ